MKVKSIAFYLPQFHPIPENNQWWGKGFTEWTNVSSGKSLYEKHYQPHIPADLGHYDLRLEETREQQAELAREYGISGFCYYHYWFNGKRLLNIPLDKILENQKPDFPFMLCWANENWTRAWDGQDREVLISQEYSDNDSEKHINFLCEVFADNRYIRVDGKPVLLIYRPDHIPEVSKMILLWRHTAQQNGFKDLYLCGVQSALVELTDEGMIDAGFDAVIDFQPNREDFPDARSFKNKVQESIRALSPKWLYQWLKSNVSSYKKIDYKMLVEKKIKQGWPNTYIKYPVVFPSWDNTARRKTPTIIENHDAREYKKWLSSALSKVKGNNHSEQMLFINAWNEWAEGCHLEPDKKHGHDFLKATKEALDDEL